MEDGRSITLLGWTFMSCSHVKSWVNLLTLLLIGCSLLFSQSGASLHDDTTLDNNYNSLISIPVGLSTSRPPSCGWPTPAELLSSLTSSASVSSSIPPTDPAAILRYVSISRSCLIMEKMFIYEEELFLYRYGCISSAAIFCPIIRWV